MFGSNIQSNCNIPFVQALCPVMCGTGC
jgi:hypothetical protein